MLDRISNALTSHTCKDPGFYTFKAILRRAIPEADLIEIAEDVVTVVKDGVATKFAY
jgi:hypothetical protein